MSNRVAKVRSYDLVVGDVIVEDLGDPCVLHVVERPILLMDRTVLVRVTEGDSTYDLVFEHDEFKTIVPRDR